MHILPFPTTSEARIGVMHYDNGTTIDLNTIPVVEEKDVLSTLTDHTVVSWYKTAVLKAGEERVLIPKGPCLIDDLTVYRTVEVPTDMESKYHSVLKKALGHKCNDNITGLIQQYILPTNYTKPVRYLFEVNGTGYKFDNVGKGCWIPVLYMVFAYNYIAPRIKHTTDVWVRYRCISWTDKYYDIHKLYRLPWLGPGIFIDGGTMGSFKFGEYRYPYTDWEKYKVAWDLYKDPRLL